MRADAAANRERLLDAASAVFAEQGTAAALHLVAGHAGVGPATLYRHFADRDALLLGLSVRLRERFAAITADAASAPSGWEGLVAYIDGVTAMHLDFPWMASALVRIRQLVPADRSWEKAALAVVERARDEGALRHDVTALELTFLPGMLGALVSVPESHRGRVVARLRDIVLSGLRPEGFPHTPPGSGPVTVEEFRRAIGRPDGDYSAGQNRA